MNYLDSLIKSMEWLSNKNDTLFIGQSVKYSGNSIFNTLKTIKDEKKIEMPVQHTQDYTEIFKKICTEIDVIMLNEPQEILPSFKHAYQRKDSKSSLIIEHGDYYNEK